MPKSKFRASRRVLLKKIIDRINISKAKPEEKTFARKFFLRIFDDQLQFDIYKQMSPEFQEFIDAHPIAETFFNLEYLKAKNPPLEESFICDFPDSEVDKIISGAYEIYLGLENINDIKFSNTKLRDGLANIFGSSDIEVSIAQAFVSQINKIKVDVEPLIKELESLTAKRSINNNNTNTEFKNSVYQNLKRSTGQESSNKNLLNEIQALQLKINAQHNLSPSQYTPFNYETNYKTYIDIKDKVKKEIESNPLSIVKERFDNLRNTFAELNFQELLKQIVNPNTDIKKQEEELRKSINRFKEVFELNGPNDQSLVANLNNNLNAKLANLSPTKPNIDQAAINAAARQAHFKNFRPKGDLGKTNNNNINNVSNNTSEESSPNLSSPIPQRPLGKVLGTVTPVEEPEIDSDLDDEKQGFNKPLNDQDTSNKSAASSNIKSNNNDTTPINSEPLTPNLSHRDSESDSDLPMDHFADSDDEEEKIVPPTMQNPKKPIPRNNNWTTTPNSNLNDQTIDDANVETKIVINQTITPQTETLFSQVSLPTDLLAAREKIENEMREYAKSIEEKLSINKRSKTLKQPLQLLIKAFLTHKEWLKLPKLVDNFKNAAKIVAASYLLEEGSVGLNLINRIPTKGATEKNVYPADAVSRDTASILSVIEKNEGKYVEFSPTPPPKHFESLLKKLGTKYQPSLGKATSEMLFFKFILDNAIKKIEDKIKVHVNNKEKIKLLESQKKDLIAIKGILKTLETDLPKLIRNAQGEEYLKKLFEGTPLPTIISLREEENRQIREKIILKLIPFAEQVIINKKPIEKDNLNELIRDFTSDQLADEKLLKETRINKLLLAIERIADFVHLKLNNIELAKNLKQHFLNKLENNNADVLVKLMNPDNFQEEKDYAEFLDYISGEKPTDSRPRTIRQGDISLVETKKILATFFEGSELNNQLKVALKEYFRIPIFKAVLAKVASDLGKELKFSEINVNEIKIESFEDLIDPKKTIILNDNTKDPDKKKLLFWNLVKIIVNGLGYKPEEEFHYNPKSLEKYLAAANKHWIEFNEVEDAGVSVVKTEINRFNEKINSTHSQSKPLTELQRKLLNFKDKVDNFVKTLEINQSLAFLELTEEQKTAIKPSIDLKNNLDQLNAEAEELQQFSNASSSNKQYKSEYDTIQKLVDYAKRAKEFEEFFIGVTKTRAQTGNEEKTRDQIASDSAKLFASIPKLSNTNTETLEDKDVEAVARYNTYVNYNNLIQTSLKNHDKIAAFQRSIGNFERNILRYQDSLAITNPENEIKTSENEVKNINKESYDYQNEFISVTAEFNNLLKIVSSKSQFESINNKYNVATLQLNFAKNTADLNDIYVKLNPLLSEEEFSKLIDKFENTKVLITEISPDLNDTIKASREKEWNTKVAIENSREYTLANYISAVETKILNIKKEKVTQFIDDINRVITHTNIAKKQLTIYHDSKLDDAQIGTTNFSNVENLFNNIKDTYNNNVIFNTDPAVTAILEQATNQVEITKLSIRLDKLYQKVLKIDSPEKFKPKMQQELEDLNKNLENPPFKEDPSLAKIQKTLQTQIKQLTTKKMEEYKVKLAEHHKHLKEKIENNIKDPLTYDELKAEAIQLNKLYKDLPEEQQEQLLREFEIEMLPILLKLAKRTQELNDFETLSENFENSLAVTAVLKNTKVIPSAKNVADLQKVFSAIQAKVSDQEKNKIFKALNEKTPKLEDFKLLDQFKVNLESKQNRLKFLEIADQTNNLFAELLNLEADKENLESDNKNLINVQKQLNPNTGIKISNLDVSAQLTLTSHLALVTSIYNYLLVITAINTIANELKKIDRNQIETLDDKIINNARSKIKNQVENFEDKYDRTNPYKQKLKDYAVYTDALILLDNLSADKLAIKTFNHTLSEINDTIKKLENSILPTIDGQLEIKTDDGIEISPFQLEVMLKAKLKSLEDIYTANPVLQTLKSQELAKAKTDSNDIIEQRKIFTFYHNTFSAYINETNNPTLLKPPKLYEDVLNEVKAHKLSNEFKELAMYEENKKVTQNQYHAILSLSNKAFNEITNKIEAYDKQTVIPFRAMLSSYNSAINIIEDNLFPNGEAKFESISSARIKELIENLNTYSNDLPNKPLDPHFKISKDLEKEFDAVKQKHQRAIQFNEYQNKVVDHVNEIKAFSNKFPLYQLANITESKSEEKDDLAGIDIAFAMEDINFKAEENNLNNLKTIFNTLAAEYKDQKDLPPNLKENIDNIKKWHNFLEDQLKLEKLFFQASTANNLPPNLKKDAIIAIEEKAKNAYKEFLTLDSDSENKKSRSVDRAILNKMHRKLESSVNASKQILNVSLFEAKIDALLIEAKNPTRYLEDIKSDVKKIIAEINDSKNLIDNTGKITLTASQNTHLLKLSQDVLTELKIHEDNYQIKIHLFDTNVKLYKNSLDLIVATMFPVKNKLESKDFNENSLSDLDTLRNNTSATHNDLIALRSEILRISKKHEKYLTDFDLEFSREVRIMEYADYQKLSKDFIKLAYTLREKLSIYNATNNIEFKEVDFNTEQKEFNDLNIQLNSLYEKYNSGNLEFSKIPNVQENRDNLNQLFNFHNKSTALNNAWKKLQEGINAEEPEKAALFAESRRLFSLYAAEKGDVRAADQVLLDSMVEKFNTTLSNNVVAGYKNKLFVLLNEAKDPTLLDAGTSARKSLEDVEAATDILVNEIKELPLGPFTKSDLIAISNLSIQVSLEIKNMIAANNQKLTDFENALNQYANQVNNARLGLLPNIDITTGAEIKSEPEQKEVTQAAINNMANDREILNKLQVGLPTHLNPTRRDDLVNKFKKAKELHNENIKVNNNFKSLLTNHISALTAFRSNLNLIRREEKKPDLHPGFKFDNLAILQNKFNQILNTYNNFIKPPNIHSDFPNLQSNLEYLQRLQNFAIESNNLEEIYKTLSEVADEKSDDEKLNKLNVIQGNLNAFKANPKLDLIINDQNKLQSLVNKLQEEINAPRNAIKNAEMKAFKDKVILLENAFKDHLEDSYRAGGDIVAPFYRLSCTDLITEGNALAAKWGNKAEIDNYLETIFDPLLAQLAIAEKIYDVKMEIEKLPPNLVAARNALNPIKNEIDTHPDIPAAQKTKLLALHDRVDITLSNLEIVAYSNEADRLRAVLENLHTQLNVNPFDAGGNPKASLNGLVPRPNTATDYNNLNNEIAIFNNNVTTLKLRATAYGLNCLDLDAKLDAILKLNKQLYFESKLENIFSLPAATALEQFYRLHTQYTDETNNPLFDKFYNAHNSLNINAAFNLVKLNMFREATELEIKFDNHNTELALYQKHLEINNLTGSVGPASAKSERQLAIELKSLKLEYTNLKNIYDAASPGLSTIGKADVRSRLKSLKKKLIEAEQLHNYINETKKLDDYYLRLKTLYGFPIFGIAAGDPALPLGYTPDLKENDYSAYDEAQELQSIKQLKKFLVDLSKLTIDTGNVLNTQATALNALFQRLSDDAKFLISHKEATIVARKQADKINLAHGKANIKMFKDAIDLAGEFANGNAMKSALDSDYLKLRRMQAQSIWQENIRSREAQFNNSTKLQALKTELNTLNIRNSRRSTDVAAFRLVLVNLKQELNNRHLSGNISPNTYTEINDQLTTAISNMNALTTEYQNITNTHRIITESIASLEKDKTWTNMQKFTADSIQVIDHNDPVTFKSKLNEANQSIVISAHSSSIKQAQLVNLQKQAVVLGYKGNDVCNVNGSNSNRLSPPGTAPAYNLNLQTSITVVSGRDPSATQVSVPTLREDLNAKALIVKWIIENNLIIKFGQPAFIPGDPNIKAKLESLFEYYKESPPTQDGLKQYFKTLKDRGLCHLETGTISQFESFGARKVAGEIADFCLPILRDPTNPRIPRMETLLLAAEIGKNFVNAADRNNPTGPKGRIIQPVLSPDLNPEIRFAMICFFEAMKNAAKSEDEKLRWTLIDPIAPNKGVFKEGIHYLLPWKYAQEIYNRVIKGRDKFDIRESLNDSEPTIPGATPIQWNNGPAVIRNHNDEITPGVRSRAQIMLGPNDKTWKNLKRKHESEVTDSSDNAIQVKAKFDDKARKGLLNVKDENVTPVINRKPIR